MKKLLSLALALAMVFSLSATAWAANTNKTDTNDNSLWLIDDVDTANSAETTVKLDVTPATFSVTLPTTIAVAIDSHGVGTAGAALPIVNKSDGPIKLTSIAVAGNGWTVGAYSDDNPYKNEAVGTQKIGFKFYNGTANTTTENGVEKTTYTKADEIGATEANKLSFTEKLPGNVLKDATAYILVDAVTPVQLSNVANAASVTITVAWNAAE